MGFKNLIGIGSLVDTELPAAAALADNTANPTVPAVGSFPHWFDGSTWDRARGDSTDGLLVNLGANNDVINAGTFAVQEDGAALTALQLIDDPVATISATPLMRAAIFDASDTQITSFGGGTEFTEDAAAAADPTGGVVILVRDDTPGALVSTDGDNVAQRGTNFGAAFCQIVDSSGSFVDTFGGGTEFNEDAAHSTGAAGSQILGVRRDAETSPVSADNDYHHMVFNDLGRLKVASGGVAAHDAAVAGNPLLLAGEARTTTPTAVADGDVVRLQSDDQGRQVAVLNAPRDLETHNSVTVTGTAETTILSAIAGAFVDLTLIVIANESTSTNLALIRDATGGTVRIAAALTANTTVVIPMSTPLTQAAVNNNWTVELSVALDTQVTFQGVQRA